MNLKRGERVPRVSRETLVNASTGTLPCRDMLYQSSQQLIDRVIWELGGRDFAYYGISPVPWVWAERWDYVQAGRAIASPRQSSRLSAKAARVRRVLMYRRDLQRLRFRLPVETGFAICFLIPLPQSYSTKRRNELDGTEHRSTPDSTNLLKALEDAVLEEDKRIARVNVRKLWTDSIFGGIAIRALPQYPGPAEPMKR